MDFVIKEKNSYLFFNYNNPIHVIRMFIVENLFKDNVNIVMNRV